MSEWKVETHGHGDAPYWIVNLSGSRFTVYDYNKACTIAAAPALLAACKRFLNTHDNEYDGEPMSMEMYDAIKAMESAVAEAEGK